MQRRRAGLLLLLACLLVAPWAAVAQETDNVPMFRGNPARTGELPGPGPQGEPVVGWTYATQGGGSVYDVTTDAERVYAGSEVGLHALDRITGQEVWRFANGNAVWSSLAVVDGVVYVGSWDSHLYALDAASGTEVWSFATGGEVDSSTAVVERVVYVGSKDGYVYAIHAASGTEAWSFATGDWVSSSPAVVEAVVYVGSWDGNVYALDAASGTEVWSFATGGPVASSPAVVSGVVYVGSKDGLVYALAAGTVAAAGMAAVVREAGSD